MSVDTRVVVGLGNPGEKYRYTRHNIAWLILDAFADRVNWRGGGKERDASMVHAGRVLGLDLVVAKPITYMNESGIAVRKLLAADRVSIDRLLVVVDDFSLPFGRLRFREGGSDGGHNGLASIEAELQTDRYPRLRVGIGDPSDSGGAHQHVLNEFSAAERLRIPEVARASRRIARVADCHVADQIVQEGREGDEIDVHGEQDQLDLHQDNDQVLAVQEDADHRQREQQARQQELRTFHCRSPVDSVVLG